MFGHIKPTLFTNKLCVFTLLIASALFSAHAQENNSNTSNKHLDGFIDIAFGEQTDQVLLQLETTQIGQTMLFQSSLPQGIGSNDIGLDRGQLGETRLIKFERFGNKVLLKQLNTQYRAMSDNPAEQQSIDEAFADSVIAGFEIEEETEQFISIDYTSFLLSDIHGIGERLSRSGQGAYSVDKSRSGIFRPRTKAFEKNTELEALVTFSGSPSGQYIRDVSPDAKSVTVHLHHSFIELPDDGYQPRIFHPYSGFWKHSYIDYSVPIEDAMEQKYIPRHRLAKKDPSAEKSEAVEPIVYYLDPGIPEPVMSALREGAKWWNQAFEAAGYIDAFQVKVLPEGADPMDIRYNVIQWVHRATRGWSYGSSVIDPRTGEILKGHVTLGSLRVRQDFLIAGAFTAPYTSQDPDVQEELTLALNRIKQLSAHEVGHTLGIAHNFAASENERASVMDYPHPYIKLDNGKVVLSEAYDDKIGDWDKYTIAYGYQDFAENIDENEALLALVSNVQNAGLNYKSDPDARIPKRASANGHLWDNGQNPIVEFERVSALRDFGLKNFGRDNLPFGTEYSDLERRLVPLFYSHRYQLDALVKQISGINYHYAVKAADNAKSSIPQVTFVDGKSQNKALELLVDSASASYLSMDERILALIPPKAYGSSRTRESMPTRMGIAFDPITAAESVSGYTLNILLQSERLNRLSLQHSLDSSVPSVTEVVSKVFDTIIKNNSKDVLEQRLKQVALSVFFDTLSDDELAADVKLSLQAQLLAYQQWLKKNDRKLANAVINKHIEHYWEHGTWPMSVAIKPMPPGSPI
jgi:hypothetical protein